MKFFEIFGIKKGDVVCIVGAGGKTSLMLHLAKELTEAGHSVLVTTTTRLASNEITSDFDFLVNINGEKAESPDISAIKNSDHDVKLIEADGSARKPLKGWLDSEPVIPEFATLTIGVLDISTIDKSPDIHRPEQFKALTGYKDKITVKNLAEVLNSSDGIFRNSSHTRNIVFLSKCESEKDIKNSIRLSPFTHKKLTYGSVFNKTIANIPKLSAVIMAAGTSSRMGENKLLMQIDEKAMITHLLDNLPAEVFNKISMIYADDALAELCNKSWLRMIKTDGGHEKNITIKLGTESCSDSDGIMFFVADQPFLKKDTIIKLADSFFKNTSKILIPVCCGRQRNPVIFPQKVFAQLMNLKGDRGGRTVIDNHPELCICIDFEDEKQFTDIDTRQEYERYAK